MKILFCYVILAFTTLTAICEEPPELRPKGNMYPPERIYFDSEDMPMGEDSFHIRIGGNEWIKSNKIHRDVTGFFTFESDVIRDGASLAYEKHWKCPYCNLYWPWGHPCGNAQCPGKFRG